jgi:hypothetical protein
MFEYLLSSVILFSNALPIFMDQLEEYIVCSDVKFSSPDLYYTQL